MNIQNKLSELRKAKKLRPMLVYGVADQPGIDVPDTDYPNVEAFLKSLFRALKKECFDIRINHWGSIFLIEPDRQIPIVLSINKTVEPYLPTDYEESMRASPYFQFDHAEAGDYLSGLVLSYRAWRPGTKWRLVLLNGNDDEFIGNLLSEMKMRVSSLVSSPRHSLPMRDEVSFDDVVALLTYNHIKTHVRDDKPAWMKEISNRWVNSCEIFDGCIHFSYFGGNASYPLMKSDIALLKKILPQILEEKIEVCRE